MMTAPQLSLLFLSLTIAVLAALVWRARVRTAVNTWFGTQTLLLAIWVCGISGLQQPNNLAAWGRLTFASAILIPPAFLMFAKTFPTVTNHPGRVLTRSITGFGLLLAALSLGTDLLLRQAYMGAAGLERVTGPLYPVYPLYFLLVLGTGFAVLVAKWRNARGLARAQLQHLGAGIGIAAAGGITFNLLLPWLGRLSTYNWVGPYFTLPFVALTAHAIIRHRLMDLRPIITRGIAYAAGTFVVSTALIVLVHSTLYVEHSTSSDMTGWITALVALVMLTTPAQTLLRRFVDPYLYRARSDHGTSLQKAMHRLTVLMEPAAFAAELRSILNETIVPDSFTLVIPGGSGKSEIIDTDLPAESVSALTGSLRALLDSGHLPLVSAITTPSVIPDHYARPLAAAGVDLVVMLRRHGEMLGALLLGQRRSGDAYFKRDLEYLEALSELAAVALENTLLYRQRINILEYSERLLESLDSAVVAVDVDGRITSRNPASDGLFQLPHRAQLTLERLPNEIGWALALALKDRYRAREVEIRIEHTARGIIPVVFSTAVLRADDRSITGALVVVTDLTTVKALEQNQRRLEHVSLMARFYAGIAHEIRNPLAAISNFVSMLPDRFDDPEYRATAARLLPMEVSRITALADRLRFMAPAAGGQLAPVTLRPLLHDMIAIHAPLVDTPRIKVLINCDDELPCVKGDPNQLTQLFLNLLRNAIDAMPNGGTIRIDVTSASTRPTAGWVSVRMTDDGPGIDPTIRPMVLEPFFTTKQKGTGLGLSICREIATFHGAQLTVGARPDGRGTVVDVRFPYSTGESASQRGSADAASTPLPL